eukprot:TRINITY_DN1998_c0_g1_i3.p1 TRINITY_DN1998_c0_g1~~TRINITY_DN1998_c0_g1_i3.p1  ORF type:complete len:718 (-),score=133.36 TRINITY_DN1998_c0_g1_i3:141-2294(-)
MNDSRYTLVHSSVMSISPRSTALLQVEIALGGDADVELAVVDTAAPPKHDAVIVAVHVTKLAPCARNPLTIELGSASVNVESRSSALVPLTVVSSDTNPLCPTRHVSLASQADATFQRTMQFTTAMFDVPPGGRVAVAAQLSAQSVLLPGLYNVSFITGDDGNTHSALLSVNVWLDPCEYRNVYFRFLCPTTQDNTTAAEFTCTTLVLNNDKWNCPTFNFSLPPVVLSAPQYFTARWSTSTLTLFPRLYERPSLEVIQTAPFAGQLTITASVYSTAFVMEHNATKEARVQVGSCVRGQPTLSLYSPASSTIHYGGTTTFRLALEPDDNVICSSSVTYTITLLPTTASFVVSAPATLSVTPYAPATFDVTFTSQADVDENVTFTVVATNEELLFRAETEVRVLVHGPCKLRPPTITPLTPLFLTAVAGPASHGTYFLNVTNNDLLACPQTTFAVTTTSFNVLGVTTSPSVSTLPLAAGASALLSVSVSVAENTQPPMSFAVVLQLSDLAAVQQQVAHATTAQMTYTLDCHQPKPPTNVTATQFTPRFSLHTAVRLRWYACATPVDCCAPAAYDVYDAETGHLIGETTSREFTHEGLREGHTYSYAVRVRDSIGALSPDDTCSHVLAVTAEAPDLTAFGLLVGLCVGLSLVVAVFASIAVLIVVCVVVRRRQGRRQVQPHDETRAVRATRKHNSNNAPAVTQSVTEAYVPLDERQRGES